GWSDVREMRDGADHRAAAGESAGAGARCRMDPRLEKATGPFTDERFDGVPKRIAPRRRGYEKAGPG
ncbi:hypothetical protein BACCOP_00971, partial [Phocaeicola coprocola DSM 17136]